MRRKAARPAARPAPHDITEMRARPLEAMPARKRNIEAIELERTAHPGLPWDSPAFREQVITAASDAIPLSWLPWFNVADEMRLLGLVYDWVVRSVGGLDGMDVREVRRHFVRRVNTWVDIPWVPEGWEGLIYGWVFDVGYKAIADALESWAVE